MDELICDGQVTPSSTHTQHCTEIVYVAPDVMQSCMQESCKVTTQTNGASHDKFQAVMKSYATGMQPKLGLSPRPAFCKSWHGKCIEQKVIRHRSGGACTQGNGVRH